MGIKRSFIKLKFLKQWNELKQSSSKKVENIEKERNKNIIFRFRKSNYKHVIDEWFHKLVKAAKENGKFSKRKRYLYLFHERMLIS